ncbi:hypothetical protein, partial [Salinimicrobium gaetbulicola]
LSPLAQMVLHPVGEYVAAFFLKPLQQCRGFFYTLNFGSETKSQLPSLEGRPDCRQEGVSEGRGRSRFLRES